MTNTSVITYDPSIAGDNKYLEASGNVVANPYQNAPFYGDDSIKAEYMEGDNLLIEVATGKLVKKQGDAEEIENFGPSNAGDDPFYSLVNRSTIQSYSPGSFTIESPDEAIWYFVSSNKRERFGGGEDVASFNGDLNAYENSVTISGSSSNPHKVTVDGESYPVIDGKEFKTFVAEVEGAAAPEPPVEETEPEPSASEAEPEPEPEPEPEEDTTPEESGTIPSDDPAATDERADETDNSGDNMAKYDELAAAKGKLIRKALGGFIMVAPMDVEVPEKVFADREGNFIDFKEAGFTPLGWLTKGDGINFSRETEQAEVESFGAQEPTRVDFTKDTTSAAFNCQETNKKVLELYYSQDLSEVTPDSETGEISFEQRDPETIYRRMIYIAHDGKGKDSKYIVKIMPKATISEVQEQSWSSESELAYGMTAKASKDDDLGYSVRHVFGGPGFEKLYADMGFTDGETSDGDTASQ